MQTVRCSRTLVGCQTAEGRKHPRQLLPMPLQRPFLQEIENADKKGLGTVEVLSGDEVHES